MITTTALREFSRAVAELDRITDKDRTHLSSGWRPNADGLLFAAHLRLNVLLEYRNFRAFYTRRRLRYVDWDGAWLGWCRRHATLRDRAA